MDERLLTVTVEEVLFRSPDARFSILRGVAENGAQPVTIVGELRDSAAGETLRVRGRWEQHPTFGPRFRVASYTPVLPNSRAGIARYLGSGLIEGIGPALAQRLVERFGDATLDVISTQSARLREVPGIGAQRADAIANAVRGRLNEAEVLSFLQSLGIGPALSERIRKRYGTDTPRIVRDDPYLAAEQIAGIGFQTADGMAQALGFSRDDPRRAAGAVLHVVGRAADAGHTFLPLPEIERQCRTLDVPVDRIGPAVAELEARALVRRDGSSIYAPPLYAAEVRVAERLATLARRKLQVPPASLDEVRAALQADAKIAPAQRSAVLATFEHALLVVTGGPGTGKTTTVRAIVAAQHRAQRRIMLCAPTGRAAKRLSDASGADAQTIHRLLEWNPRTGSFARNHESPLETDVVLVDEASMLDVQLAQQLLDALPPSAALILVGDADQLPPIGPGPVLRELIDSGVCRVVRLTEIFRQAEASGIVRGAHAILHGQRPPPTPAGTRSSGDLFLIRVDSPEQVTVRLCEVLQRMREVYGLDPIRDVQVMTPMRRGPLGTQALNELLQRTLNPASDPAPGLRAGDKIMQLRNDYERELWNGEVGTVQRVDAGVVFADMNGRETSYEPDAQHALSLAYACTVHKVQGSEFPAAIIVLHRTHHMLLTRPLIYTALTRAKRLAVIIGDDTGLSRAIHNTETRKSHTRLAARLTLA